LPRLGQAKGHERCDDDVNEPKQPQRGQDRVQFFMIGDSESADVRVAAGDASKRPLAD
jgi:hypothetical protein